jgi:predicted metalloenzyme YecM
MTAPTPFLRKLFAALAECWVDVSSLELDHLCYRVEDLGRYNSLRKQLDEDGTLLSENNIGGRPIACYRLHVPFRYDGRSIDVLELPAPKSGSPYPEGYEHAEFVVREDLLAFTQRYPRLGWDLSALAKPVNADVRLRFEGFSVKFHRRSLASVIGMERSSTSKRP